MKTVLLIYKTKTIMKEKTHKKIFLTSYFAGTLKQFQLFIKDNVITDKEIAYIHVEEYTDYIDEGKEALKERNFMLDSISNSEAIIINDTVYEILK